MDQAVTRCNDLPPWYRRKRITILRRDMCGGFAKQFQIAHGRVIVKTIGNKRLLVESLGIGEYLLGEIKHVVEVKAPLALRH
jgi:hypothetical protein